ncbi:MAG: HAMP domain-containing sensor histidine kinase [Candidatus Izemoplasmatales bacterium]|nr:HAMP domain-containing sensor histidine kinase [Candidatus Izemoplasmatales bacterium]
MKIRNKLIFYFGLLLSVFFLIALMLTGVVIRYTLNRLLYSNVFEMNSNIVASIQDVTPDALLDRLELISLITGVEIIVRDGEETLFSSFDDSFIDFDGATKVSQKYNVFRVVDNSMFYYYTESTITPNEYEMYVFRTADLALTNSDEIFYTSFVGILFLGVAVSALSLVTAKVFSSPIRDLASYANQLAPEAKVQPRPVFRIKEYNELGLALEKAAVRLNVYRQKEQEFLHNFSHEMKTPLTNIYGYAEAMQFGVLSSDETKNACNIIMTESEKLRDNINQIMLLGRLDSVNQPYHMQRINLADLLSDCLNSVQIQAKDAKIALIYPEIDPSISVFGDPDKLETAFVNIMSNGLRYATSDLRIEVAVRSSTVEVFIDDDGIGIPSSEREKVFERYYIGYKGHTGLGLTITKMIFDKHQIGVVIEDSESKGARFHITFPGVMRQHR